ncbi:glycosyltransferase family 8 protein [Butyrivibrio fibrisolvens]|uniref:glycosyltransferase family 8 protein n=1 Tax=Butyrivibrio fibrisolvens TaxID=831 RepID=UPI000411ABDF|nr:glycosyltransferase [Butyrivibrio fibrisolvens]
MSKSRFNALFFIDINYVALAYLFFKGVKEEYNCILFSCDDIETDIEGYSYNCLDNYQVDNIITFDYVVIASDKTDEVYGKLKKMLTGHQYKVMTMLEAAAIMLTFEGYIDYLRFLNSSLISNKLPTVIIDERNKQYTNDMQIVMSFNSKFLLPSITTIYTLFLYNNNCHVHIFYLDLSENERIVVDRLTQLGESNIIEWHLITDNLSDKIHYDIGRFSLYSLYRFFSYQILDESIDKCLWLDSDLMIRGSIRELYEIDLEEYYFAGALEASDYENNALGKNRESINTGILLMNLNRLRSDDMIHKFWETLFSPDFSYSTDQEALNVVFRYKIKFFLQTIWNSFPITYTTSISEEDFTKLVDITCIVHWLSAQKAWLPEYEGYWRAVAEQYPYAKIMYEEYQKRLVESVDFVSGS